MHKENGRIDLHVHSNRSDGTFSPMELVDYAIEKKLSAFALTDHDTVAGIPEALSYANTLQREQVSVPEIIPGIELSSEYQGLDIHMVGLYIDYQSEIFCDYLQNFINSRITRNHKMCEKLTELGFPIQYEELLIEFPDAVITRAHYAKLMLKRGYVKSLSEAFERYIGDHAPCFIPREKVTPAQAIQLILEAGGIPILAHPILYHMSKSNLDTLVGSLKEAGLMGIEAIYSTYCASEEREIRTLAKKYDLLISGGSDFHGANKPGLDLGVGYGNLYVPESVLTAMKEQQKRGCEITP